MNILLAKGTALRFTPEGRDIIYGGSDLTADVFLNLARVYPQHSFYLLSSSKNLDKLENAPNNLFNLYKEITSSIEKIPHPKYHPKIYHYKDFYSYIDKHNIHFDKAIVHQMGENQPVEWDKGYISQRTGEACCPRICDINPNMFYCVIKHYNIPYILLQDDPREINKIPRDLQPPFKIWGQYNGTDNSMMYKEGSLTEMYKAEFPVRHKMIDRLWLRKKPKIDWRTFDKTNKFIMAINPLEGRAKYLKKWIIDRMPDIKIYGNWNNLSTMMQKEVEKYNIDTSIFEDVPMTQIEDLMFNTRYTLVIPTKKNFIVTQKPYSMLYYGIIPFWCKNDYDVNNIYGDFPDYIKVSSVDEFYNKMDELDNNLDMYQNLKEQLWNLLDDKYFCDDIIHEIFDEELN